MKNNNMKLSELIAGLPVKQIIGSVEVEVTGIQFDSRKVGAGHVFVAQKGTTADGHTYVDQCIAQGAAAIVISDETYIRNSVCCIVVENTDRALGLMAHRWFGSPSERLTLVGVTGTNGKTTIATLLYKLVRALGHKAGLLSTVVNYIDDEAVASTHTTPDALALNELLSRMVAAGCKYAFMEVSSHSIAQERIAGLQFNGAIFTNLTRDHIDYHKTFDNYRDTKKRLFDQLPKGTFAITNKDDKNGLVMVQNTKADIRTYSTRSLADFKGVILEEGFEGMLLSINNQEVFVPLVGRINTSN